MTSRLRRFNHHQRAFQNALWSAATYIRRGEHLFETVREHLDGMAEQARGLGDDAPLAAMEASRQQLTSIKAKLDCLYATLEDNRVPLAAAGSGVRESAGEPDPGDLGSAND